MYVSFNKKYSLYIGSFAYRYLGKPMKIRMKFLRYDGGVFLVIMPYKEGDSQHVKSFSINSSKSTSVTGFINGFGMRKVLGNKYDATPSTASDGRPMLLIDIIEG